MIQHQVLLQDRLGNARVGIGVNVFIAGTQTRAPLYATNNPSGPTLSNPRPTDDNGYATFYIADGVYSIYPVGEDPSAYALVQIYDLAELKQTIVADAAAAASQATAETAAEAGATAATEARRQMGSYLLSDIADVTIDSTIKSLQISGIESAGDFGAGQTLVAAAHVDADYVAANLLTSALDAAGRGFRLSAVGAFERGIVHSGRAAYIYHDFDCADGLVDGTLTPTGHELKVTGPDGANARYLNGELRAMADTGGAPNFANNCYIYADYGSALPSIQGAFKYRKGAGGNERKENITTMIAAVHPDVVTGSVHPECSLDLIRVGYFFGLNCSVSITGTTATISGATINAFGPGTTISRHPRTGTQDILPFTKIVAQLTGTTGGNGNYTVDQSQSVTATKAVAFNEAATISVNLPENTFIGVRFDLDYTNNAVICHIPNADAPITVSLPGLSTLAPRYPMWQIRPNDAGMIGSWGEIGAGKSIADKSRAANLVPLMGAYGGSEATFRQPEPIGTYRTLTGAENSTHRALTECPVNRSFAGFGIFAHVTITAKAAGKAQIIEFYLGVGSDGKPLAYKSLRQVARPIQALSGAVLSWRESGGNFNVALDLIKATEADDDVKIWMDVEGFATIPTTFAVDPAPYENETSITFETVSFEQEQAITITGDAGWYTIAEQAAYSGFGIAAKLELDAKTATRRNQIGLAVSSVPISATVPMHFIDQTYFSDDNGGAIDEVRLTWEQGDNPEVGENAKSQVQVQKVDDDTVPLTITMRSHGPIKLLSAPVAGVVLAGGEITMPLQIGKQIGSFVANGALGDTTTIKRATTDLPFTIPDNVNCVLFTDSATVASGTITMPANPIDGQEILIMGNATITALTFTANTGQTMKPGVATTLTPAAPARVRHHNNTPTSLDWYRA